MTRIGGRDCEFSASAWEVGPVRKVWIGMFYVLLLRTDAGLVSMLQGWNSLKITQTNLGVPNHSLFSYSGIPKGSI